MKVILLKDVAKIGKRYEVKEIAQGYAQNLLIPKGMAIVASAANLERFGVLKSKEEDIIKAKNDSIAQTLAALDGKTITMKAKANDKGHLFAGLHQAELVKEIERNTGTNLPADSIELKQPLKSLGDYPIKIKAGGHSATVNIKIESNK